MQKEYIGLFKESVLVGNTDMYATKDKNTGLMVVVFKKTHLTSRDDIYARAHSIFRTSGGKAVKSTDGATRAILEGMTLPDVVDADKFCFV